MQSTREITVFLKNEPGTLSRVTGLLGEHGIDIMGFTLSNSLDHGALRIITNDAGSAIKVFAKNDLLALENDVVELKLNEEPGALGRIASALAEAKINVDYAYGSTNQAHGDPMTLYMRVSDIEGALAVMKNVEGAA